MTPPRPALWNFDCRSIDFVLSACLDRDDYERLGLAPEGGSQCGLSPHACLRNHIHQACHRKNGKLARRIMDYLNVRHIEHIMRLESMAEEKIDDACREVCEYADHSEVAGWTWALLCDPRHTSQHAGRLLVQESLTLAYQRLKELPVRLPLGARA